MRIRTTKTSSGATAVQVIERHHHTTDVLKHIGSATDFESLSHLRALASQYIREQNPSSPLFPEFVGDTSKHLVAVEDLVFTKAHHQAAYEFFSFFYERNGFTQILNPLLKDLAIMRLIEPCSKLQSLELLKEYFHITYGHTRLYRYLREILAEKDQVENIAVSYAKKHLAFDFSLVFYDVTTLYFETFKEDGDTTDNKGGSTTGLRKIGYGKEKKPGQPQIVIGLVVNKDGYPISIETFSGKVFEGHTMLPVIQNLKQKYAITNLTIVADAAMLSLDNMNSIQQAGLSYIVGARTGSIPLDRLEYISKKLHKREHIFTRTKTDWGTLVCDYSKTRAAKDRSDRKKQLEKAHYQIQNPEKAKKRSRFVMEATKATLTLNEELIAQDKLREGIKGYYTNLKRVPSPIIVKRYHDLWHVEKSFRIAKSDLDARPIFHHQRDSILAHMLIVFVSLCLTKSIELVTHLSLKRVKKSIWPILDIEFKDTITGKTFTKRMETKGNTLVALWRKLKK